MHQESLRKSCRRSSKAKASQVETLFLRQPVKRVPKSASPVAIFDVLFTIVIGLYFTYIN